MTSVIPLEYLLQPAWCVVRVLMSIVYRKLFNPFYVIALALRDNNQHNRLYNIGCAVLCRENYFICSMSLHW